MPISISRADLERRMVKLGLTAEEAKSIMSRKIEEFGLKQDGDAVSGTLIDNAAKIAEKADRCRDCGNRFDWMMN